MPIAVHERLAATLREAIGAGLYRPGDRLPTHRALAQQHGVSIGSVTRAIDTLSAAGVVRSEVGRGTFVAAGETPATSGPVDLSVNAPTPVLTAEALAVASGMAGERALRLANGGYVDLAGTQEQRQAISLWLGRHRAALPVEDMVLCSGAQQGLHLAMAVLGGAVGAVVTEAASFPGAIAAAANLGLPMLAVAHDQEGPVPAALESVLRQAGPAAVYLTPVCHNPLGYETGPERRAALAAIVRRHGGYIIEDDIYGVFAGKGGPLYRDLLPERTFYVTALSKSVTPLVRLGVIVPPTAYLAAVRKRLRAESWGLPPLAVELAVALVETGGADAALAALRREARQRVDMVAEMLGIDDLPMPGGAPHVWLEMAPLRAEQMARRAGEAGIRLGAPSAMQVGPEPVAGIRLCLMAPPQPVLRGALATLARLLEADEDVVV